MKLTKIAQLFEVLVTRLNEVVHRTGFIVLVLLIFLTIGDVFGRYFFTQPILGTFEITGLMLAVLVFFSLGYTQIHRGHIRIDLIASYLSPKKAAILDSTIYLVSFIVFSLVVWQLIEHAYRLWVGHVTSGVLSWPIYPFVFAAAFGCLLYSLVLLLQFMNSLAKLVRREP